MMQGAGAWSGGSRLLLKRLRDVMAGPGSGQEQLDRIVRLIAAEMVAEVCSCYVVRGGVLELFATEGLKQDAVHRTRLRIGEGLVGDVALNARPLALADAQSHPNFAYRPETGEEIYHSLMGAPMLRGGRVLGVLVVQNRSKRQYAEEEVEALETIAMVVSELVAGGHLVGLAEPGTADETSLLPARLEGTRLHVGLAIGTAVLHTPRITVHQLVAEDPAVELERLKRAVSEMHEALDLLLQDGELAGQGEHRDVLEAYRMFAEDRGWLARIREAIASGLTAEAAVQKVQNDTRARMAQITDAYLRERLLDLEDLNNRLLAHLAGADRTRELPEDAILIARNMGPAELLDYDRTRLRALVLEEGSATAHVAIVARALDLPTVARVPNIRTAVEPGDRVVVDGTHGVVYVRPAEDIIETIAATVAASQARQAHYYQLKNLPAVTQDGTPIALYLNAGLMMDVAQLEDTGADGVGLYRTEIPFMVRTHYPDLEDQTAVYRTVLERAGDKPVVFRTLDAGGDKRLPYFTYAEDENPAMGWRALRISLDRPSMLRQQLRALIRAASGRRLFVMFPMVSEVAEYIRARAILELELERAGTGAAAGERPEPPSAVKIGAMLEVPALLYQLPALLARADFVSVGSNDLLQFFFASDRGSPRLAERYDSLSPPVLALLWRLTQACERARVPLTMCGEMASRPLEAMALLGLGFRSLSMPPATVGAVKTMARSLAILPLRQYIQSLLDLPDHSVREKLRGFAQDHGVIV